MALLTTLSVLLRQLQYSDDILEETGARAPSGSSTAKCIIDSICIRDLAYFSTSSC
ncbi:hypothetical protein CY34DRAFT_811943 [Suillus luteus UH-Slu-Lm8-n1]|uniref:Uncharacterized protein n=1 Tax=Suillus luteus UH-Slu-Lm8-n1 TaxID=930992 RepID=A0A0C9ZDX3_9AGAM|nr:hypothetical protein CY34DRAFT_811943 [Suillus luteus UH-Slu-Lm8-n1]